MHTIQKIVRNGDETKSITSKLSEHQLAVLIDHLAENVPQSNVVAYILLDTSDQEDPKATYLYRDEPATDLKQRVSNPVTPAPKVYNHTVGLDRAEHWKVKSPFAKS